MRAFDIEAMMFHFGMQPIEAVGQGVDADDDGVVDEIFIGERSALHVFNTHLERPELREPSPESEQGFLTFEAIGCADCHRPSLRTRKKTLGYSFPEVETDPGANVFYQADLSASPPGFDPHPQGGLDVPLFSDLKRHDMGPDLAESFGSELDPFFITARLWGVADTATCTTAAPRP